MSLEKCNCKNFFKKIFLPYKANDHAGDRGDQAEQKGDDPRKGMLFSFSRS